MTATIKPDLHILGICGTFMAGMATLARQKGYEVSGSDAGVYPPMSTLLESLSIPVLEGYLADHFQTRPGLAVIGNALSRGNEAVEAVLEQKIPYTSGPAWLRDHILPGREVFAVAGTHGKTSTASMLAWIFDYAGKQPGFLIGGKPGNFDHSAQLGEGAPFVVEADEYDTAFFDKRSKFVHYRPQVAILNNLEFDHADIFADIEAIKTQFHQLIRTIPGNGKILLNADDANLADTLKLGCWTPFETFSITDPQADWFASAENADASEFILHHQQKTYPVSWSCFGQHNMSNALAAIAAASAGSVPIKLACEAMRSFKLPAKRLQSHSNSLGISLYEDFAHHPTAIEKTLQTLRDRHPEQALIAVLEPRSNTMKMGVHGDTLAKSLQSADQTLFYIGDLEETSFPELGDAVQRFHDVPSLAQQLKASIRGDEVVVIMSNGDFGGLVRDLSC